MEMNFFFLLDDIDTPWADGVPLTDTDRYPEATSWRDRVRNWNTSPPSAPNVQRWKEQCACGACERAKCTIPTWSMDNLCGHAVEIQVAHVQCNICGHLVCFWPVVVSAGSGAWRPAGWVTSFIKNTKKQNISKYVPSSSRVLCTNQLYNKCTECSWKSCSPWKKKKKERKM